MAKQPKKQQTGTERDLDLSALTVVDFDMGSPVPGDDFGVLPTNASNSRGSKNDDIPELPIESVEVSSSDIKKSEESATEAVKEMAAARKKEEDAKAARKKELLVIFDQIMFEGHYEEVIKIGSSYRATYRTRSAREDAEISRRLDSVQFNTAIAYQNSASLMTLAYSLAQFGAVDLRELSVNDRYKYVSDLPGAVITLLSSMLYDFDQKILEALEFGKSNF